MSSTAHQDMMALLAAQKPLIAGDSDLEAAWRAGRRDWRRHFGG